MIPSIRELPGMWISIMAGTLAGVLASVLAVAVLPAMHAQYDATNLVTSGTATVVSRDGEGVIVEVVATKRRDCTHERMVATTRDASGIVEVAFLQRVGPTAGVNHPVGTTHRSRWRVWPTSGAVAVRIVGVYDCDGRTVTGTLGEARL
jgi:hypothetical protein